MNLPGTLRHSKSHREAVKRIERRAFLLAYACGPRLPGRATIRRVLRPRGAAAQGQESWGPANRHCAWVTSEALTP